MKNLIFKTIILTLAILFFANQFAYCADLLEKAQTYFKNGIFAYEQGKYVKAENEFEQAIKLTEKAKKDHYEKGLVFYQKKEYQQARNEFAQAIEAGKKANEQHYQKGLALYKLGKFKESEKEFAAAMSKTVKKENQELPPLAAAEKSEEKISNEPQFEYIIGNGDVLLISVWQNNDLNGDVIVRPDGKISFPLVGEINAAGLTISNFKEELVEKLKEYIRAPQVTVAIKSMGGKKVIVLGEVRSPGIYSLTGNKSLLEAIGLAGGFTEDAVLASIIYINRSSDAPIAKRIDLASVFKIDNIQDKITLESEDVIYVPRRFIKNVSYFTDLILAPITRGLYIRQEVLDLNGKN